MGSVDVSNTSSKPLLPASLELPVGAATAIFHLPRLTPGQVHEDLFSIPTQRRDVIVVGPVMLVVYFFLLKLFRVSELRDLLRPLLGRLPSERRVLA